MSSDKGTSSNTPPSSNPSAPLLNNDIQYYESNLVPHQACLDDLNLYTAVAKSMSENSLGKRCFAIEMNWFQSFENYGKELLQIRESLEKQTVL